MVRLPSRGWLALIIALACAAAIGPWVTSSISGVRADEEKAQLIAQYKAGELANLSPYGWQNKLPPGAFWIGSKPVDALQEYVGRSASLRPSGYGDLRFMTLEVTWTDQGSEYAAWLVKGRSPADQVVGEVFFRTCSGGTDDLEVMQPNQSGTLVMVTDRLDNFEGSGDSDGLADLLIVDDASCSGMPFPGTTV